jgi:hypothetical protein
VEYDTRAFAPFAWTADVLAFSADVDAAELRALMIVRGRDPYAGLHAWPGGFVDAAADEDARAAAVRELREETGQGDPAFLEELGTYGRNGRDPRQHAGFWDADAGCWRERGNRVVTTAHLALLAPGESRGVVAGDDASSAAWEDVYRYLPWEDLRAPAGRAAASALHAAVARWAADRGDEARARVERAFGHGARWNEELAPDRLRLAHAAGLLEEARRDRWGRAPGAPTGPSFGTAMAFDHREILADALGRLRGKLKYVPAVLHALVGDRFTLDELQRAAEAVAGRPLHRANFRRTVAGGKTPTVVRTGETRERRGRGVDPRLHAFRPQVLTTRLEASWRMPWASLTGGE